MARALQNGPRLQKAIILLDVHGEEYMKSACGPVNEHLKNKRVPGLVWGIFCSFH